MLLYMKKNIYEIFINALKFRENVLNSEIFIKEIVNVKKSCINLVKFIIKFRTKFCNITKQL